VGHTIPGIPGSNDSRNRWVRGIRNIQLGFSDRNLANELASIISDNLTSLELNSLKDAITANIVSVSELISTKYPAYFTKKLTDFLAD
jgi:hypothetical protein